jgi:hypothetical protein
VQSAEKALIEIQKLRNELRGNQSYPCSRRPTPGDQSSAGLSPRGAGASAGAGGGANMDAVPGAGAPAPAPSAVGPAQTPRACPPDVVTLAKLAPALRASEVWKQLGRRPNGDERKLGLCKLLGVEHEPEQQLEHSVLLNATSRVISPRTVAFEVAATAGSVGGLRNTVSSPLQSTWGGDQTTESRGGEGGASGGLRAVQTAPSNVLMQTLSAAAGNTPRPRPSKPAVSWGKPPPSTGEEEMTTASRRGDGDDGGGRGSADSPDDKKLGAGGDATAAPTRTAAPSQGPEMAEEANREKAEKEKADRALVEDIRPQP